MAMNKETNMALNVLCITSCDIKHNVLANLIFNIIPISPFPYNFPV